MSKDRLVLGGRFKLIRHLGGGGMAEVFLAEQVSLGRQVALKVLKRDLSAQPAMGERFRREAQLLSTVDHPSVVRVIDFETNKRDGTVLVLELAEGETLEKALRLGPFEPRRAIRVLLQLAEGLAAVHERGIIHRDLKPQNIVIGPGPRGEQARLLDFGIARLMELDTDSGPAHPELPPGVDPFMSLPGQAIGTPAYVAPEQAMAQPVDPRTDVYAFGVVAFRMLAGRLPFEGPEARDYLEQHVRELPPPLDAVAPHVGPFPLLVKLVMSCLEKKAVNRPKDGAALVQALRSVLPADQLALSTQTRLVLSAVTTQTLSAVKDTATSFSQRGMQGVKTVGRFARRLDKQFKQSLAVTAGLTLLVPAAWAMFPPSTVERAETELREGKPAEALTTIDAVLADSKGLYPVLLSVKVGALHELGREDDARAMIRQSPYQTLFPARPAVLEMLVEGYAASETDPEVVEWLSMLPPLLSDEVLRQFAKEGPSARQWGALRYLDGAGRTKGLSLPERYAASLQSAECSVRARAAVRLGELGDAEIIPALRELSETPKDEKNCGQDEAGEAIRTLKRVK
ncbi:MAG: serine/threonine-protein kinase [Archangium sp.]|nr:serine/threonine-protein kinase [Archangium sp.]MDP3572577.1 serine/threonine-protein kinase [Archangium sp.]